MEPSLEEVGEVEAVLSRLLHERQTIEKAVVVLQVYKAVAAQNAGIQQQLLDQQAELVVLQEQVKLEAIHRAEVMHETEVQVADAKERLLQEAHSSIVVLQDQITQLQSYFDTLNVEATRLKAQNEKEQAAHVTFVEAVQAQVVELRKEYADLQDAFTRSSKIIGSISIT